MHVAGILAALLVCLALTWASLSSAEALIRLLGVTMLGYKPAQAGLVVQSRRAVDLHQPLIAVQAGWAARPADIEFPAVEAGVSSVQHPAVVRLQGDAAMAGCISEQGDPHVGGPEAALLDLADRRLLVLGLWAVQDQEEAAEPLAGVCDVPAAEPGIDEHQAGAGRLDQEVVTDKAPQLSVGRPVHQATAPRAHCPATEVMNAHGADKAAARLQLRAEDRRCAFGQRCRRRRAGGTRLVSPQPERACPAFAATTARIPASRPASPMCCAAAGGRR